MKISSNISYREATHSNTAIRNGIENKPNDIQLQKMIDVATYVFEPLRAYFHKPIRINSFFRCLELNKAVGGASKSQHINGEAIDMDALHGVSNAQLFNYIKDNLDFDKLIWEYGTDKEPDWVHVSYRKGNNRKQVYKAVKGKGYIKY